MVKDITTSHFWTLMCMGYDMQRIWDANYIDNSETIYLDYKDYVPYSSRDGEALYDYTRYKILISEKRQLKYLTVRKNENFDYDKYFSNNNLPIK